MRRWLAALFCWAVGLFAFGTAWTALRVAPDMAAQLRIPVQLDFVVGILFALLFGVAGLLMVRQRAVGLPLGAALWCAWVGVRVARTALFAQADYERGRLPFALLTAALCVLPAVLLFVWRPPQRRDFFHGREHPPLPRGED